MDSRKSSLDAWARHIVHRHEQIWRGHDWAPHGWTGWYALARVDHCDHHRVTVSAVCVGGVWPGISFDMASQAKIEDVDGRLAAFSSELPNLRPFSGAGGELADIIADHPVVTLPPYIRALLVQDLADPALVTFNKARAVLCQDSSEWSRNMAARP